MRNHLRLINRRRPLSRLRQRTSIHPTTVVIGLSALIILLFNHSYLNLGLPKYAYATTMSAAANGDWTSASSWSAGRVPQNGDTLTIPVGRTINVNVVTQEYIDMKIIVYGTLHFDGGKKIRMCDGIIDVAPGAILIGENHGSKVDICSVPVWTGDTIAFGPLTITGSGVLPVELVYFKAAAESNSVNVQWQTASQTNCDYFSVEHSRDGKFFTSIASIKGNGNSNQTDTYNYTDLYPYTGTSYYRLKEVDFDGASQLSQVVSVTVKGAPEMVVYPNPIPAGNSATVEIPFAGNDDIVEVSAISVDGKKIFSKAVQRNGSSKNTVSFTTETFPSAGTFFLVASGPDTKMVKKILVQ